MTKRAVTEVRREAMRIGGESVHRDRVIEVFNPYTEQLVGTVPKATRRRRAAGVRVAKAYKPKLTRFERAAILNKAGELIAQPHRGDRRPDHRRVRPVQEGLAVRGRPRQRRAAVSAPTGLKDDGQIFSCDLTPHGKKRRVLHAARAAARRHQRDHAVQPPDEPGGAQGRAVDRHQQPDGAQAVREDAASRRSSRRRAVRGRAAARDVSGGHRRPGARSPTSCSPTRTSTWSPSPAAWRSASTSPRKAGYKRAWCSSSAATTRSS